MPIERIGVGKRMSQAVVHGDAVYLAGQVAHDAAGQSVAAQTRNILRRIETLLTEAGSCKGKLLMAYIWLADIATFGELNAMWDGWVIEGQTPGRATVKARLARPEYGVEIAVVAAR